MDAGENIRVVLRVRPLNGAERSREDRKVIECSEDRRSVQIYAAGMEDFGRSSSARNFSFNEVFDGYCDQQSFFDRCGVKGLVSKALAGYSATLFAYGQTGSGKTYSVSGPEDVVSDESYSGGHPHEGIIPRAARYLYQEMCLDPGKKLILKAACFEIYNEQVLDLLNPEAGQLQIRESRAQGFFVENLLVVECSNVSDLMDVFKEGTRNRHVGPHALNRDSSRSHCLLVLYVDGCFTDEETGEEYRQYGKLTFVDLAGSERLKYSGSSGDMQKETGSINRSLFTLGKVIAALDRQDKTDNFVPYRDSKLTKLLMDSLGGNSSCIMVACCSPSIKYAEETLSTLHYASRAKNIRNKPIVQLDPQQRIIQQLRQEIVALRAENAALRVNSVNPELASAHITTLPCTGTSSHGMLLKRSNTGELLLSEPAAVAAPSVGSTESRTPLYEKAVGYAEGYAQGLQQAREALSSRGLDLASCLTQYDLCRIATLDRRGSSKGGASRLPPLDAITNRDCSVRSSGTERGHSYGDTGTAESASRTPSGGSGHDKSLAEYARETAELRAARAELEYRCRELELQCDRLRGQDVQGSSFPPNRGVAVSSGVGSGAGGRVSAAEAIIAQTKVERLTAENAELKRMLKGMIERGGDSEPFYHAAAAVQPAAANGGVLSGAEVNGPVTGPRPAAESVLSLGGGMQPRAQASVNAAYRSSGPEADSKGGSSAAGRPMKNGSQGGLFCSAESALWNAPHWSDPLAPPPAPPPPQQQQHRSAQRADGAASTAAPEYASLSPRLAPRSGLGNAAPPAGGEDGWPAPGGGAAPAAGSKDGWPAPGGGREAEQRQRNPPSIHRLR